MDKGTYVKSLEEELLSLNGPYIFKAFDDLARLSFQGAVAVDPAPTAAWGASGPQPTTTNPRRHTFRNLTSSYCWLFRLLAYNLLLSIVESVLLLET